MVNRITPALGAEHMQTYALAAPLATHWRPATCEEVDCANQAAGWRTVVDEATDLGQRQAAYVRTQAGRAFGEHREGPLTVFTFPAGQRCFAAHQQPLEREPLYLVRGGDWRGNPRGVPVRRHVRAADWVDDFANHQLDLRDRLERG
jgi:hypothetical protein